MRAFSGLLVLVFALAGLPALAQRGGRLLGPREPAYTRFVTRSLYQSNPLLQKRTPPAKLPRRGGARIRELEALLSARYRALVRSDTAQVLSPAQCDSLAQALRAVRTASPKWSSTAYVQEALFYGQEQAQRQLQQLYQRFCQAQAQRQAARTAAEASARPASFAQAARAGQAAEQAQNWAGAEVYFARCRALQPTDSATTLRYAFVAEQCLFRYFSRFLSDGQAFWAASHHNTASKPEHWPAYTAALPQAEAYVQHLSAAYGARWQAGQRAYLYQQVATLLSARQVLPAEKAAPCVGQAYAAVAAYGQRYGNDTTRSTCWQLLHEPNYPTPRK